MTPHFQYPHPAAQDRVSLLTEVVQVLTEELSTISECKWENLPDLKKKKVVLASRLQALDWSPPLQERETFDLMKLRTLIAELEEHSRKKIQGQLELIGNHLFALQDQHQHWRECLNISFRRFHEAIPCP